MKNFFIFHLFLIIWLCKTLRTVMASRKKTYTAEEAAEIILNSEVDVSDSESITSCSESSVSGNSSHKSTRDDTNIEEQDMENEQSSESDTEVMLPIGPLISRQRMRGGTVGKRLQKRGGGQGIPRGATGRGKARGRGRGCIRGHTRGRGQARGKHRVAGAQPMSDSELSDEQPMDVEQEVVDQDNAKKNKKKKKPDFDPPLEWTDQPAAPPDFDFDEITGLKSEVLLELIDMDPESIFNVLFDDELVDLMVVETNRYAEQVRGKENTRQRHARLNAWKPVDAPAMKKFVGIFYLMGIHNFPRITDYWSKDDLYRTYAFKTIMLRNRFQLRSIYVPDENLSLDESMVLWRGRLVFRQYIKNKKHKYGVKFYELCESDGIILRISIYSGESYEDDEEQGQTYAIVKHLMEDYLDKGYSLYTDNYYNSIPLTRFMTMHSTCITGTLRNDRRGLPKKTLVKKKLNRGDHVWYREGSTVVCKWKDKRDVLVITNKHAVEMVRTANRHGQEHIKPNVVVDYNNHMSGIDRSDQMMSYYSSLRKTTRWYKKLGCHILELLLYNAFEIYRKATGKQMKELQFRERIIRHLVGPLKDPSLMMTPTQFHYLVPIPPTLKKQNPTRKCYVCAMDDDRRKETRYMCEKCDPQVSLCVHPCFRVHHEKEYLDE